MLPKYVRLMEKLPKILESDILKAKSQKHPGVEKIDDDIIKTILEHLAPLNTDDQLLEAINNLPPKDLSHLIFWLDKVLSYFNMISYGEKYFEKYIPKDSKKFENYCIVEASGYNNLKIQFSRPDYRNFRLEFNELPEKEPPDQKNKF